MDDRKLLQLILAERVWKMAHARAIKKSETRTLTMDDLLAEVPESVRQLEEVARVMDQRPPQSPPAAGRERR